METQAATGRQQLTDEQYRQQFPPLSRDTQTQRTSLPARAGLNPQEHAQWVQHVRRDPFPIEQLPIEQPKPRATSHAFESARSGRESKKLEKRRQKNEKRLQEQSARQWHKSIDPNSTTQKSFRVYKAAKSNRYKGEGVRVMPRRYSQSD